MYLEIDNEQACKLEKMGNYQVTKREVSIWSDLSENSLHFHLYFGRKIGFSCLLKHITAKYRVVWAVA